MSSKRQMIDSLRSKLKERNADSNYSNKFLYNVLIEQSKWLIRREIAAGRIYKNSVFFQTLRCQKVIETSIIDPCCPIKTNCKIYRTECKIPDVWIDTDGPVVKGITSVDGSTYFDITSAMTWDSKRKDPYQKKSEQMYAFFGDGYYWFPEKNPHRVNISGFWVDDVSTLNDCSEDKDCVRYLDTKFMLPDWLEAEMFAKTLAQLVPLLQLPEDVNINKNPNVKN